MILVKFSFLLLRLTLQLSPFGTHLQMRPIIVRVILSDVSQF